MYTEIAQMRHVENVFKAVGTSISIEERADYTRCLAHVMGIDMMRVDLSKSDNLARDIESFVTGVECNDKPYRMITGSSGAKSKRYAIFSEESIANFALDTWFGPNNITRLGCLLTPVTGWFHETVKFLIVDNNDYRYGTGDGLIAVSEKRASSHNGGFDQAQVRGAFPALKAVLKCTEIVNPRLDAEGLDFVVNFKSLKSENPDLKVGDVITTEMWFGVVKIFDRKGYGKVGYQVMQAMDDNTQDLLDQALPNKIAVLNAAMSDPYSFVQASEELVSPRERDMLAVFADLSIELQDKRLMYSRVAASIIEELQSKASVELAVSGGVTAPLLACRDAIGIPMGTAVVHPLSKMAKTRTLMIRNPFTWAGTAFVVEVTTAEYITIDGWECPVGRGSVVLNPAEGLASARDCDGDELLCVTTDNAPKHVIAMCDYVEKVSVKADETRREKGSNYPADRVDALIRLSSNHPGPAANQASKLHMLKHKRPDLYKLAATHFAKMCSAMQAAVDTKHWPESHEDDVKACREFTGKYINEREFAWVKFANGSLMPWITNRYNYLQMEAKFPKQAIAKIKYGELIDPRKWVDDTSRIAQRFVLGGRFGDTQWPVRMWNTVPNERLLNMIPAVNSQGYQFSIGMLDSIAKDLISAHAIIDPDEREQEVHDILSSFDHQMELLRDNEDDVAIETFAAAIWQRTFSNERATGKMLLRTMVKLGYQVFKDLIRKNFKQAQAVFEGTCYGSATQFLNGTHDCRIVTGLDSQGQNVQKLMFGSKDTSPYLIVKAINEIPEGKFVVKTTRLNGKNGQPINRATFVLCS